MYLADRRWTRRVGLVTSICIGLPHSNIPSVVLLHTTHMCQKSNKVVWYSSPRRCYWKALTALYTIRLCYCVHHQPSAFNSTTLNEIQLIQRTGHQLDVMFSIKCPHHAGCRMSAARCCYWCCVYTCPTDDALNSTFSIMAQIEVCPSLFPIEYGTHEERHLYRRRYTYDTGRVKIGLAVEV